MRRNTGLEHITSLMEIDMKGTLKMDLGMGKVYIHGMIVLITMENG